MTIIYFLLDSIQPPSKSKNDLPILANIITRKSHSLCYLTSPQKTDVGNSDNKSPQNPVLSTTHDSTDPQ